MIHLFIDPLDNKVKYIETLPVEPELGKCSEPPTTNCYELIGCICAHRWKPYEKALSLAKRNSVECADRETGMQAIRSQQKKDWESGKTKSTESLVFKIQPGVIYSIEGYKAEIVEEPATDSGHEGSPPYRKVDFETFALLSPLKQRSYGKQ